MATLSITVELAWFQHGNETFHIKVLAFACPRATLSIRRDYRRPLPAWLFNISFRKSCLIGWRRDTPLPPLLYYGQRAPKRYASLQTSLTSSTFRASELPYRTWRTLSALHSPRYAPPPNHGRSLKRPSALLAGSSSKVWLKNLTSRLYLGLHEHFFFHTIFCCCASVFSARYSFFCSLVHRSFPRPGGLDLRWEEC